MSEEETTEVDNQEPTTEQLEAAHRLYLSEIMEQLTQSDRFNRFMKINYDIQTYFNEEEKTFDIRVLERPPEMAAKALQDMLEEHAKEHEPAITLPTRAEIEALKKDFKH